VNQCRSADVAEEDSTLGSLSERFPLTLRAVRCSLQRCRFVESRLPTRGNSSLLTGTCRGVARGSTITGIPKPGAHTLLNRVQVGPGRQGVGRRPDSIAVYGIASTEERTRLESTAAPVAGRQRERATQISCLSRPIRHMERRYCQLRTGAHNSHAGSARPAPAGDRRSAQDFLPTSGASCLFFPW
jgi:hypothetical protein